MGKNSKIILFKTLRKACKLSVYLVKYTHGKEESVINSLHNLDRIPKNNMTWRNFYECLHNRKD